MIEEDKDFYPVLTVQEKDKKVYPLKAHLLATALAIVAIGLVIAFILGTLWVDDVFEYVPGEELTDEEK